MVDEIPVPPSPTKEPVTPPTPVTPTETPVSEPKQDSFDINKFMEGLNADVAKEETAKMTSFQKAQDEKLTQVAKAVMEQSNEQMTKLAQIIETQNKQIQDMATKYGETSEGTQAPIGQTQNPFNEAPTKQKFDEHDPTFKAKFFKRFNI